MFRRTALAVTAGALALGGAALLVPSAASATGASSPGAVVPAAHHGRRLLTPPERQELRTTGHLTLTRHTPKHGTVTVLVQRGEVTALSPTSITLRSKDGYSHNYVITAATKVREKGQPVDLSDLRVGERAMVIAVHRAQGDVARRIGCLRPAA